jgi:hypothetical protein
MKKLFLEFEIRENKGFWYGSGYWLRVTNVGRKGYANREGRWMMDDADVTGLVGRSNRQQSAGG